ncbi:AraC family transcriptional regulator [Vibrio natriegens]|uniref:AraC family transcriptional regulator n=1 Tax=Vibrio natriegens NBRC 15636 = ATCC 14048 = DSM 759 TaxID=1219067 RepID=A0AAN0Y5I9_VIBNA|nr:AraC family transcriptional regulator [Vibrio natriegens]ALR18596.1 AraC family transcriptional regulator [Vibrio natriegens NBRC 15636 = ATCC 14048 = DSM 759]ANQ14563.1 AraC family transcriptional regulator [Vibrio natriegens NBRC 15636 = ATCC 14048 = DSM 759]EPM39597.1 AraC family transcriptional regulator [Vibrio natriegens NBRC 15636 = ATCC 14048 = DSM 759]MDX6028477.1 AraC family transcriptional regulator [Vibrio natriegens NBRC 15636 = ATCC 14048 = DSM 759]UUI13199.1 AraC family trans
MNDSQNTNVAASILAEKIQKWTGDATQFDTEIPGLRLSRWTTPTPPTSYTHNPSICLIAQGKKRVFLGDDSFTYDANHFLISSVDLPITANIMKASEDEPYLGLIMELDLQEISQLIVDSEFSFKTNKEAQKGIAVGELSGSLQDAFIRLMTLLDEPDNIKILAPVIKREIFYRLLMTEQGARLNQIVTTGSHSHQIAKAIDWLKNNFVKPLSVGDLAAYSGMSKSAFYTHFRSMTSMTPLQFQKKLRLSEARRLMLTENLDAMATTFKVGYESPSQFSREYSRLFGLPPSKDIKALKEANIS